MIKVHSIVLLFVIAAAPPCLADEPLDTESIISALMEVTSDANEGVRYAAFSALKRQPRSDQLVELFWRGVDDDNLQIRGVSLEKIVELEGPTDKVLERLVLLTNKGLTADDRQLAEKARLHLISIGAPAIPHLIDAIKKDETSFYAMSALGDIPLGEHRATVTKQLTSLLKSEDSNARQVAVQVLESIMIADAKSKADAMAKAVTKELAEARGVEPRYLAYYVKLLQKYDSNADGSLTKDEWSKMSKDPAEADVDQDGVITAVELAKWSMIRR